MATFNSDVVDRLAVAIDLANSRATGLLTAQGSERPNWIFETRGYAPPADPADWAELAVVADEFDAVLRASARGEHDDVVETVNGWLEDRHTTPYVERRADRWVLHFHTRSASFALGWAGGMAAALALGYGSGDALRIGACSIDTCGRLFLDRGRNRRRRFCSLRCQNRAKSAAYRARGPAGGVRDGSGLG